MTLTRKTSRHTLRRLFVVRIHESSLGENMNHHGSFDIRVATDADVNAAKNLFIKVYGEDYPFKKFYDAWWLKKAVFDDDTLFLVAEDKGHIVGTISTMLTAGRGQESRNRTVPVGPEPCLRGHPFRFCGSKNGAPGITEDSRAEWFRRARV
jgi:hypothetical protein